MLMSLYSYSEVSTDTQASISLIKLLDLFYYET